MKQVIFLITIVLFIITTTPAAFADTCLSVNGGGPTTRQICPSPTPKMIPLPQNNTTAGGQTVYPPGKGQSTPDTGPEATGYILLLGMLAGGIYLRGKAKAY